MREMMGCYSSAHYHYVTMVIDAITTEVSEVTTPTVRSHDLEEREQGNDTLC